MPLMVCGGQIDMILGYPDFHGWKNTYRQEIFFGNVPKEVTFSITFIPK